MMRIKSARGTRHTACGHSPQAIRDKSGALGAKSAKRCLN